MHNFYRLKIKKKITVLTWELLILFLMDFSLLDYFVQVLLAKTNYSFLYNTCLFSGYFSKFLFLLVLVNYVKYSFNII